ncbi:sugar ABC transporter ATP-binding protein [Bacillus sp. FJAT-42376]|uniref:sugar ABC transporter ATP-binding protein n=1 Tax=Bacillus sp. FJAT-42376 TaxID=2014076 RepID=UPI000F4E523A|nr:sugar ABC transporter ATP-binding protein [Bacillus sp. FJAT-42376]AZB41584.1 sugar ABC transporter ATP-binding protein [Bacillus sp. FJAT-42376]
MSLLQMKNISKSFGRVRALEDAQFELRAGEVHALLGANGAGKSTLMKILSGAYTQDSGEISINGKPVQIRSPREAKELGIDCVYQEVDTALVPTLTVADNIMLDSFSSSKKWTVSRKKLNQEAKEALRLLQEDRIPAEKQASELTLAQKQMVLIARALVRKAKIIIFDEPTAPLSIEETKHYFTIVQRLVKQGVGCIFISHRLPEVFEICDRITVMRDGSAIQTFETADVSQEQIIETMLGRALVQEMEEEGTGIGRTLLQVDGLEDEDRLKDISFSVAEGEVVAVAGLVGAGKTELAKTLFGLTRWKKGTLLLNGKPFRFKEPAEAIKAGLALVPEERRKEGLFIHESIQANMSFPHLKSFSSFLKMNRKKEKQHAEQIITELGIKTDSPSAPAENLSGGNQQKVAIGKWMSGDANVYLFDEPTKGVDVGAKKDIFQLIRRLAEARKGILYFSCEINEILGIADRVLIMYDGRIVKELSKEEATQDRILLYASGGKEDIHEGKAHRIFV